MSTYAITDSQVLTETVDDGRPERIRRERWEWRGHTDSALVGEYTAPAEGPVRGTVVLVHGLAQNRFTWRVSARSLPAALAGHGIASVNLELRGHGLSRGAGSGNAHGFKEYVQDIVRVVQSLDGPVVLMGHSLGAAACIGACTEVPVRGVVHLAGVYAFATTNPVLRGIARLSQRVRPLLLSRSTFGSS